MKENGLEEKSWEVIHVFDWNCFCEVKSWNFLSFLVIIEPNLFSKTHVGKIEGDEIKAVLDTWLDSGKKSRKLCIDDWGGSDKKPMEKYISTQGLVSFM